MSFGGKILLYKAGSVPKLRTLCCHTPVTLNWGLVTEASMGCHAHLFRGGYIDELVTIGLLVPRLAGGSIVQLFNAFICICTIGKISLQWIAERAEMTIKRSRDDNLPSWRHAHSKMVSDWGDRQRLPTSDPLFTLNTIEQLWRSDLVSRASEKREKVLEVLQTIAEISACMSGAFGTYPVFCAYLHR
ncbi:hypothetical protein PROFUN_02694 [Planoprotostelium fungivorum]|uniref:Uncharacterized protein n=1 Tax=Planoprotostelium fungivorum TaxID=1890364 RepID=A0A2P6NVF3_9EUKA|nr:hypothetical protein PROFUN_02694 [Planoprotostelium fungivorum]